MHGDETFPRNAVDRNPIGSDDTTQALGGGCPDGHVVVVGNEKGGSGKSTTAMHLIVGLLREGFTVASIDLDARQATLSRYFENRRQTVDARRVTLPMPEHYGVSREALEKLGADRQLEQDKLIELIRHLRGICDYLVIDTPGSDGFLSRVGHSFADTLITPINDSFVDLDLLARIDPETLRIVAPSIYSETVWEQRKARLDRDRGKVDWIVMRNRLSGGDARNKRDMRKVMEALSRRIGFRVAPGFGERVIFRELFLEGLTLLDLRDAGVGPRLSFSHVAARQEVRALLRAVGLNMSRESERGTSWEVDAMPLFRTADGT